MFPVCSGRAGLWLPAWLLPRVHAFKCIELGRYRCAVSVHFPALGRVFGYAGLLALENAG